MRLHTPLDEVLTGRANLRALRALVRLEGTNFSGSELAREAGIAPSQARSALIRFEQQGMVHRRALGWTYAWKVAPHHLLYRALKDLVLKERGLMDSLERDIAEGLDRRGVARAALFGSVLTGEERADSDIDLWVEVADDALKESLEEPLLRLRDRIADRYGNSLSPIVHSSAEAERSAHPSLVREARERGRAIRLKGST